MLSQVIVMACAAVATVRSNVGPNVASMGPNFGGTSQQSQQSQQSQPHSTSSHYTPLTYPPFLRPPTPCPPSPYRPDLCPPQRCQPQAPYILQGLPHSHPTYIRTDDGSFYYVEPKNPFELGHYFPSPGEYNPDVAMALGHSGAAAQRSAGRGVGGLGRSKRHAA